jgi:hypothetical protein
MRLSERKHVQLSADPGARIGRIPHFVCDPRTEAAAGQASDVDPAAGLPSAPNGRGLRLEFLTSPPGPLLSLKFLSNDREAALALVMRIFCGYEKDSSPALGSPGAILTEALTPYGVRSIHSTRGLLTGPEVCARVQTRSEPEG